MFIGALAEAAVYPTALNASAALTHYTASIILPPPPSVAVLNGIVVDGYYSGCTILAADGRTTTSDANGNFNFVPSPEVGSVITTLPGAGCIDTLTGVPLSHASQALASPVDPKCVRRKSGAKG